MRCDMISCLRSTDALVQGIALGWDELPESPSLVIPPQKECFYFLVFSRFERLCCAMNLRYNRVLVRTGP